MDTYVILRRSGWATPGEVEAAAERSAAATAATDDVEWIRTYVVHEPDGRLGTVCVYRATGPEAIHAHAAAAGLPVDEIVPVADTMVVSPDP